MNRQATKKRERERTPNNRTTTGFRISDELWAVLHPLLPVHVNTHRFGGGRPRKSDRECADAIFYVLRTGCQWQALDQTEHVAHSTAHDRFQEWVQAGVFLKLWQAGLSEFDELRGIDWEWLSMDGAIRQLLRWAGKKLALIPPIVASAGSNAASSQRDMGCQSAWRLRERNVTI